MRDVLKIGERLIISIGYCEMMDDYSVAIYGRLHETRMANGRLRSEYRFRLGRWGIDGQFYLCPAVFWSHFGRRTKAFGIGHEGNRLEIWRW